VIRALVLACVLGTSSLALAQAPQKPPENPNEAAKALALRLGTERSVEGLQTIIESRNVDLLQQYERGFRQTSMNMPRRPTPLPAGIEALLVKHYADPVMGGPLRVLCAANGTVYRSRQLFDLLFAEWRSRKVRPSAYPMNDSALNTDQPGIEAPLLEWLQAADAPAGEDRRRIVSFLGRRQYAPAAAPLIAMLGKGGDPDAVHITYALLELRTPEAIEAVLEQVVVLRNQPPENHREAWEQLALRLANLPASVPLPYKRFRAAMPAGEPRHAVAWLIHRKDMDAVPDVLAKLADPTPQGWPLQALIDTDSPEVWRQARAEVERLNAAGRIQEGRYRQAVSALDAKIADPAAHFAEKRTGDRNREYSERRTRIDAAKTEARKFRRGEPERYLAGLRAALEDDQRLLAEFEGLHIVNYAREQVAADHLEMGHVIRFRMKRPQEALEEYARAERHGSKLGGLGIADLREHELRDKSGAIAQYRKLLAEVRAMPVTAHPGEQGATNRWMARWLESQLRYLEKGETFSGVLTREDVAGGVVMAMAGMASRDEAFDLGPLEGYLRDSFGAGARPLDRRQVAQVLEPLPASAFVLMRTAWYVGLLPDAQSILRYLARHDPAGFGSASIFAVADHVQKDDTGSSMLLSPGLAEDPKAPSPLAIAKERFLRERRIQVRP
jgi:hypothetical protein